MSASTRTRQRPPRRKQRVSKSGNAAPGSAQTRRRQRLGDRVRRGAVWVFLAVFVISVVGIIIVAKR